MVLLLLKDLFELLHCDLWGPYKYPTSFGSFYFLTMWMIFLICMGLSTFYKSEFSQFFEHFYTLTQTKFGKSIKIVHSYNGTEFVCFLNMVFVHQTSIPLYNNIIELKENIGIF